MKRLLFILATAVALNVYATEKPRPTTEQVHRVIKLTKKHLPIGRYFADDDDEEDYSLVQPMISRRESVVIKHRTNIAPTEDDVIISDEMRVRLFLARVKAMQAYDRVHGSA
jgi:hypothetical protein